MARILLTSVACALVLAAMVPAALAAPNQGVYKPEGNLTAAVWTGADLPQFGEEMEIV